MKFLPVAVFVALVGAWFLLRGPEGGEADRVHPRPVAPSPHPTRDQGAVALAEVVEAPLDRTDIGRADAPSGGSDVGGTPQFVVRATSAGLEVRQAAVYANGTLLGKTGERGALTLPLVRVLEIEHRKPVEITVERGALRGRRLVQPRAQEMEVTLASVSILNCAGRVVDEAGRGIAGLEVAGGGRAVVTDDRGAFELSDVPPELRRIRIHRGAHLLGKYACVLGAENVIEIPGTFSLVVDVRTAGSFRGTGRYVLSLHGDKGDPGGAEVAVGEFQPGASGKGGRIEFRALTAEAWRYSIALHVDGHRPLAHLFEPPADGGSRQESVDLEEAGPLKVRLPGLGPRPARIVVKPRLAWGRAPALEVLVGSGSTATVSGLVGVEKASIEVQTELSPTGQYLTVLPFADYTVEKGEVRFDELPFCTLGCALVAAPGPGARPILLRGTFRPDHVLPGIGRYSGGAYVRDTAFEEWLEPGAYEIHMPHGGISVTTEFFAPHSIREGDLDLAQDWGLVFEEPPAPTMTCLTFQEEGAPLAGRRIMVQGAQPNTTVTDAQGRVLVHAPGPFQFEFSVEGPEGMMAAFRTSREAATHLEDETLDVPKSGSMRLVGDEPLLVRLRRVGGRHYFYPSEPTEKPTRSIVRTLNPGLDPMKITPGTWQVTVVEGSLKGRTRQVDVTALVETTLKPETW